MDYSKFTDADLVALQSGDLSKLSVFGLRTLKQERLKAENPAEYDQESPEWAARVADKYDPTKDMSGPERVAAGVGKAVVDVGRGLGQFVPVRRNGQWDTLVTPEDIRQSRQLDAPLMNTTGGKVGNFGGNVAVLGPTALITGGATLPGALTIGGATGFLSPAESFSERAKNTGLGGLFGVGGVLAGRTIGAGVQAARALVDPLTKSGEQRIAAQTLQAFASDPVKAAANLRTVQPLVPGSLPTMAQAADDVGLAQLERTLVNNPETGKFLGDAYAAQRAARLAALQSVAGTPEQRAAAVAAREAAAGPFYKQAAAAAYELDPAIQSIFNTPIGQRALKRAEEIAKNERRPFQFSTQTSAPFRGVGGAAPQTKTQMTGQALQDIKMAFDDMLGSAPLGGISKSEAKAVEKMRGQVIDWMEGVNPDFKTARQTFARESIPINTMDVARELGKKFQPALAMFGGNTREQANAYATAVRDAMESVKKSTGINKAMEDLIDPAASDTIKNIARDMARKANAEDLGRAAGSNTAQNLAAQNLLRRTLGPTGLPQSWAESGALQTFLAPYSAITRVTGAEANVMRLLADAAQDPALAARLLEKQIESMSPGLLSRGLNRALPVAANAGLLTAPSQ